MYTKQTAEGSFVEYGRTETINNNLNPEFHKVFNMNYFFEKTQYLKFEVVDDDGAGSFDMIGTIETTMAAIMGAKGSVLIAELKHKGKKTGTIIVRAESVAESNKEVRF